VLGHESRDKIVNFALFTCDRHDTLLANRRRKSKHKPKLKLLIHPELQSDGID
jgi:hypothetical protein